GRWWARCRRARRSPWRSAREAAVAAPEEDERTPLVAHAEVEDPAEHAVVVAGVEHPVDLAVDPGQHPVEQRCAGAGGLPADADELVVVLRGEASRELLLVLGEDVHAEHAGLLDAGPGGGVLAGEEADERRVERHRAERADRHADVVRLARRRDDGDPRGEVAEDLPEASRVEGWGCCGHRPEGTRGAVERRPAAVSRGR